jgi:hypothetical protein
MMKNLSEDIYNDSIIALNRYVEMALVFFNTMVALMLLTAPWYIVTSMSIFPLGGMCEIPSGTVIAPFASKFCDKDMTTLIDGGSTWKELHVFVWVYFVLALLSSGVIGYEIVKHGIRDWKDSNTVGFVVQIALIVIQSLILIKSNDAVKPEHVDDSTARVLTITALSLSCVRAVLLVLFMYVTFKYNKRGYLGTGAYS